MFGMNSQPAPKTVSEDMHKKVQEAIPYTHELFCLRDSDASGYGLPQPALNGAMFIREMEMVFKNPDHPITKYPHKFEIYQCGTYDYRRGLVISQDLRFVGLVSDFKPKQGFEEPVINRN